MKMSPDTKIIIISSPKYGWHKCLVDEQDFEELKKLRWGIHKDSKRKDYYAWSNAYINGKHIVIKMHRLIMGVTDPKIQIDHKDHNGLNNQRSNLRLATHSQNSSNKPKPNRKRQTSIYKGVCKDSFRNKWKATIRANGKWKFIGRYCNEIDAALAYNEAAKELHGEFAYLNRIEKIKTA